MSFTASNIKWICFINGIEVPLLAASVSSLANELTSAQITLPYSPFLSRLPKHTKITLFSLDYASVPVVPRLEFDGVAQIISWRKDRFSGNTGLFIMAQTDGIIWSSRKKFNFYLDNCFGVDRMASKMQDIEQVNNTLDSPIFDPVNQVVSSANGDGGRAATLFLTHMFNLDSNKKFSGTINYKDCGTTINTVGKNNTTGGVDATVNESNTNPNWYAHYIQKYYQDYNVLNKVCRINLPDMYKQAFGDYQSWNIVIQQMGTARGEVNFWNFAAYLCDLYGFEIFDISDCAYTTISQADINYLYSASEVKSGTGVPTVKVDIGTPKPFMAEYLIKPKSPFGPIPLCNIVFPDQVLDKSFQKNFQMEVTRVNAAQVNINALALGPNDSGIGYNFYQGPFTTNPYDDYFGSFNINKQPINPLELATFMKRSSYEDEFGSVSKTVQLPDVISRMFATILQNNKPGSAKYEEAMKNIQSMMNHHFMIAYTDKVQFTMQVTPDVQVVPGMPLLVLDENGEHIVSYCTGREKSWSKDGQYYINLKLQYARPYDIKSQSMADIIDPFDPHAFPSTYAKDISMMANYIGCMFMPINEEFSLVDYTTKLVNEWYENNRNTNLVKTNRNAWRTVADYFDYQEFMGVSKPTTYDTSNAYNKMHYDLISKWDVTDSAARMAALQWSYAPPGKKVPDITYGVNVRASDNSSYGMFYKPNEDELSTPGPIKVSPYIAGIVNCHNRYLMQIGNNIS
jgi:hypothetical protein